MWAQKTAGRPGAEGPSWRLLPLTHHRSDAHLGLRGVMGARRPGRGGGHTNIEHWVGGGDKIDPGNVACELEARVARADWREEGSNGGGSRRTWLLPCGVGAQGGRDLTEVQGVLLLRSAGLGGGAAAKTPPGMRAPSFGSEGQVQGGGFSLDLLPVAWVQRRGPCAQTSVRCRGHVLHGRAEGPRR